MSSIKLKHSGGNSVSIAAPSSNPASNRTINLNDNYAGDGSFVTANSSGNVGIGNTSPQGQLHIGTSIGTSDREAIIILNNGGATGQEAGIEWRYESSTTPRAKIHLDSSGQDLRFATANSERVRINSTGTSYFLTDAGTGCTVMQSSLSAGTSYNLFQAQHSVSSIGSNGTQCWFVTTNGNTYNTNNSYGSASDINLKENIVDAKSQWNDIKALKVRNFNFKNDSEKVKMLGVVAQELEAAGMSGLVNEHPDIDENGNELKTVTKSVKYSILYMKAIKALQEAITKIETLEAKVAALEAG